MVEGIVSPSFRCLRFRGNGQCEDRHVIDAAPDDQWLGNADGNAVHVGADLLVHAQDGLVRFRADEKARRHQNPVIVGLAVNVLDAVDGLHDGFERFRHQALRVLRFEAIGADLNVDHGNRNLRLLLAR